jgi:hypothetical protein
MKYYIIQRLNWEYNDEVYHTSESGGGTPEKIYSDAQKAQDKCDELNAAEMSGLRIMEYGYDLDDVFRNSDKANAILAKLNAPIPEDDNWDYQLPKMTAAQYKKLAPCLNVKFFEVVEVEGE